MAYTYTQPQQFGQNNQNQSFMTNNQNQSFQNQNIQPLFPQPQGNVYNINSTLEVANVPVGAGISVALCLNEGFMYIKTLQNGNPLFWAYKITPYDNSKPTEETTEVTKDTPDLSKRFEDYDNRFDTLEKQVVQIQKAIKTKDDGEWKV